MTATAELLLTTVDAYRQLPTRNDVVQELHWGQVVALTRPKMKHTKLQYRLVELLRPLAQSKGVVASEVPFRALPEYDLRGADVAFVSRQRWDATDDEDNLRGSPELVIEVLSPSNTKRELREKAALYLSKGCEEFWIVDPKRHTISVTKRAGESAVYERGDRLESVVFDGSVAVTDVFR